MAVYARDAKHRPGRPKTDVLDAVWLCKIAERQMLRPSFVPPKPIRQLRDLTRYRRSVIDDRSTAINRLHKTLQGANIKLASVATDIMGKSGRAILDALRSM